MGEAFSESVDSLLRMLKPARGQKKTTFPRDLDPSQTRFEQGESIHEWFVRMTDTCCDGEPIHCELEANIGMFAALHWDDCELKGGNISTVIANADLESFYVDGGDDAIYMRFDLDYGTLGKIPFSHPIPHIHLKGDSPRLPLPGGSGNVVMDFLEFIYLNFAESDWMTWAELAWNTYYFRVAKLPEEKNPFNSILNAFKYSKIEELRGHEKHLRQWKKQMQQQKDKLFPFHVDESDRKLLEYPVV